MAARFSSIQTRISLLVLVPLLALASLWVFLTGLTYGDANALLESRNFQEKTVTPTQRLIDGLQKERRLAMAGLGDPRLADGAAIRAQRQATDQAAANVRAGSRDESLRNTLQSRVLDRIDALVAKTGSLAGVRRAVDERASDREHLMREYNEIVDAGFAVFSATSPAEASIADRTTTLTSLGRAREYMSRQDALLTGALAAGRITPAERAQFTKLSGARHAIHEDSARDLPADNRASYERITAGPQFVQLTRLEDQVIAGAVPAGERTGRTPSQAPGNGTQPARAVQPGGLVQPARQAVIDPGAWRSLSDHVNGEFYTLEGQALDNLIGHAQGVAIRSFVRLALAGGVGLITIVVSSIIAARVSRRLVLESRALATGVWDFTHKRLPKVAEHIRAGRPAEPEPEPEVEYRINEIRQIADSFELSRDAVIRAAENEVAARRGISEVFVNLARRNQALLHRQLSLLDSMERRTEDPSELSDLFRLDHLATRMRRHAEGLVILAGKPAGRGWRRPVPLVDVVRGAVAEVEDYPRVRVQQLPRVALLGSAVGDVIHLLAEIVENATTFSPPQSPVRVSGQPVANGFAIEVEDRGLGMTEEQLRTANARLADPPEFDPSDSAQLGLFVVARLAERHGIQVTLRPSPYGGTTAIALIPGSLIVEHAEPEAAVRRATGPIQQLPGPAPALSASPRSAVEAGPAQQGSDGVVRLVEAAPAEPDPAPEPPPESASGPVPEPAEAGAAPEPELRPGELPKRRRQQHLAPQLKRRVDEHLAAHGRQPPEERPQQAPQAPQQAPQAPPPAPPAGPPPGREPAGTPLAAPVPFPMDVGPPAPGGAPEGGTAAPSPDGEARSPEAMRSMMSAMQRGWQRGRQDAADPETEAARNPADQEDDAP